MEIWSNDEVGEGWVAIELLDLDEGPMETA